MFTTTQVYTAILNIVRGTADYLENGGDRETNLDRGLLFAAAGILIAASTVPPTIEQPGTQPGEGPAINLVFGPMAFPRDERPWVFAANRRIYVMLHRSRVPPVHVAKPASLAPLHGLRLSAFGSEMRS